MRAFVTTLPLSGLASSSGTERVATRMAQVDLLLCRFLDEALIPCVIDEGARLTGCRPASTLDGHLAGTVRAGLPARCTMHDGTGAWRWRCPLRSPWTQLADLLANKSASVSLYCSRL